MMGWTRAQVLLGTLVTIEVDHALARSSADAAMAAALARISHIGRVMSAHDPNSDLARLSRAHPDQLLELDPATVQVLRAARDWTIRSGGTFDPVRAAQTLVHRGARPGLQSSAGDLRDMDLLSEVMVRVSRPVSIDLGGIAKGYAVDQAMQVLRQHAVTHARVNAGGDLAVMGHIPQRIALRHAGDQPRSQAMGALFLREGAVATSVACDAWSGFVARPRRATATWRSATVTAPNCMTADALTKWALQSSVLCPSLRHALREHRATLWRSP